MKKSQAAMEFLMTYGWAIMIIFIVIGSLTYLGIFDLPVPTTCDIPNPYICRDLKVDSATDIFTIKLEAVNIDTASVENKIKNITVNGVTCTVPTAGTDLRTASETPVTSTCDFTNPNWRLDFSKNSRFEGTIKLGYQKLGGSVREVTGSFSGKTE
ncbi:hypothetical protein HY500_01590 [Candidatus Woesearchaeota archaeon]|nr:hypothetical protein [Candidatus Woesearchaeota archaeon]